VKIVVYEMEQWERQAFERLTDHDVVFEDGRLTVESAARHQDADIVSVFIYSHADAEMLSKFRDLKPIATRSTGVDHIDREYCKDHHITICNVPTYGSNTVAEHAFGLLLTISHNIYDGVARTRQARFSFEGLRGFDLLGKTLGVVGTGDIGAHVIRIAHGFGMNVLAYDIKPRPELRQELTFDYVELDTLLAESDIITIHVPGIPQTRDMIAAEQFRRMKKGMILINTSRGTVVNIQDLVQALHKGIVAAAGLDVLPQEPLLHEEAELMRSVYEKEHGKELAALLADNVLFNLDNVYITPHSAFNTREAQERILDTTIGNIGSFLIGEPVNVKT
jgi:D-lactate dehydrogenase